MSTLKPVFGPTLNPIFRGLFADGYVRKRFTFNGIDQFATMPGWAPLGLPFEISVWATPLTVDGLQRDIYRSGTTRPNEKITTTDRYANTYASVDDINRTVQTVPGAAQVGVDARNRFSAQSDGTYYYHNGALASSGYFADLSKSVTQDPVTAIAAAGNGANLFHGPISSLRLRDNSPIQDTDTLASNGVRYITIPEFVIPSTDAGKFTFEAIRTGDGAAWGSDDTSNYLLVQGVNIKLLVAGVNYQFTNAALNLAAGQHFHATVYFDGTDWQCSVDGGADIQAALSGRGGDIKCTQLYGFRPATPNPTGFVLQNVAMENTTTGNSVSYKIDEGTGTAIDAYNSAGISVSNTGDASSITDQPLWETDALMGDGARYIEVPQFSFGAATAWTISFDWIRQDFSGVASTRILGNASGTDMVVITDTGNASPNRVSIVRSSGFSNAAGALDDVAIGEHVNIRLEGDATGNMDVFVNDILTATATSANNIAFAVTELYRSNSNGQLVAGSALQNVVLSNTGDYIQYKIDEGTGLAVLAYDINGDAIPVSDGTITPDADWEYQTYGGTITPDADWQNIPNNSRLYPINEGSGDTLYDVLNPAVYSPELLVNGGFDTDTDWTKGDGWTISNGEALCGGTQVSNSSITQSISVTSGQSYEVAFTISARAAGSIRPTLTGVVGSFVSSVGTHTELLIAPSTGSLDLSLQGDPNFDGSISIVSVKEVLSGNDTNATIQNYTDNWG